MQLPYDLVIELPSVHLCTHKKTCTQVFIAELFVVAQN